jgi:hypothetical protein
MNGASNWSMLYTLDILDARLWMLIMIRVL